MKTILIVEDKEKMKRIYANLLEDEGFKVFTASDAVDANETLKKEHVDLVLLDIKMPKVQGDVLNEVMRMFHKKVKVIVSSVYPLDEQKKLIKNAVDYYDKSRDISILLKKINKALKNGKHLKKRILVVDDEPKIRSLFSRHLKERGYETLGAEDGEAALKLLKKNNDIDLVILDIILPYASGMDIYDVIKKEFPNLKIIISSVYLQEVQEFMIWDGDAYYYKADDISVLMDKVDKILGV